jgi:Outer membrane protein beta-barrel domain
VRKTLGLVWTVAALCVMSWAQQIPGEAPETVLQYPRAELFGGYSYGYTDLFNSGKRAGLNGWNASLTLNAAKWMGFVIDGSGNYGTSKIPVAVPAPFPTCPPFCPNGTDTFDVKTTLYSYLFGARFPYRKSERWTPFGEVLFGRAKMRGEVPGFSQVSSGLSLLAGGGADYKISPRFALRFKADYFQTRGFKQKQDNLRFSVGIVIRTVPHKKRTLEDENPPQN